MTAMLLLDAVSPLERIRISGQIAAEVAALASAGALERVKIAGRVAALLAKLNAGEATPERLKNFGWDAVKLSDYSLEQLAELRRQVEAEHANPFDEQNRYTENGQPTIHVYDAKGRKKLEKLAWAVTYKLQERKAPDASPEHGARTLDDYLAQSESFLDGVRQYFRENLQGRTVPTAIGPVQITGKFSWNKMKLGMKADELKGRMVPHVVEILQHGQHSGLVENYKERTDDTTGYYFFWKRCEVAGQSVIGGVRVAVRTSGEFVYNIDHDGSKSWADWQEKTGKLAGVRNMPNGEGAGSDEGNALMDNVAQGDGDINIVILATEPVMLAPEPPTGRAPAGGTIGMNGEFYRGGSFLPNTTLPKQGKAAGGVGVATGVLIEPELRADAPAPGYGSIFAHYREFIDVTHGVASVVNRPDAAVAAYVNEDVAEGRAFLRAAADAYNAGMRWYKPGEIEVTDEHRAEPEAPAFEIIEHTTGRNKIIRGIVRTDLSYAEAKAIDEYTFRKNGGFFIREKHLEAMGLPVAPAAPAEPIDPARQAELEAEREQQRLQAEADRLANEQARQQQKREQQVAKLRQVAASTLEKAEQEIGRDRLANTARRAAMAASGIARAEADRAIALTMNNLADAIERGQAQHLAGITSRADVQTLMGSLATARANYERAKGMSYADQQKRRHDRYSAEEARYAEMPRPRWDNAGASRARVLDLIKGKRGAPALADKIRYATTMEPEDIKALRNMLGQKAADEELGWYNVEILAKVERLRRAGITTNQELRDALVEFLEFREGARAEDPIAKAERAILGQKVGIDFFPTPAGEAQRMARKAGIKPGDRVLEPSAGNGNLADAAKAAGAEVDVIEISSQLRDILTAKGYTVVAHDFESFTPAEAYDAIIMNPPFSNRRDADHVMRAFGMLKPGGRLVAIAGEGVFIGRDAKAQTFRDWLDQHGAEVEALAQGTFKDTKLLATTGANARLITLTR